MMRCLLQGATDEEYAIAMAPQLGALDVAVTPQQQPQAVAPQHQTSDAAAGGAVVQPQAAGHQQPQAAHVFSICSGIKQSWQISVGGSDSLGKRGAMFQRMKHGGGKHGQRAGLRDGW